MSLVPGSKRSFGHSEATGEGESLALSQSGRHNKEARVERSEEHPLCTRCAAIDFDKAFSPKYHDSNYRKIAKLGHFDEVWKNSQCPLCRLFAAIRPPSNKSYALITFFNDDFCHSYGHKRTYDFGNEVLLGLAEWWPTGDEFVTRILEPGCGSHGLIRRVEQSGEQAPPLGRALDAKVADLDQAREWLQFCQSHHNPRCTLEKQHSATGMKLIDCVTRAIILAAPECEYAALSYVCGPSTSANPDDGTQTRLPPDSPQVIEDAVKVTREMGYRYLWVDRYCINSKIDGERQSQIGLMGLIYQNAEVTLVDAAGKDASVGLAGAGSRSRAPMSVQLGEYKLCLAWRNPELLIRRSTWMSRGWTYQEAILSRRRLIFTEDQLFFECACMHWCEATTRPLLESHTADQKRLPASFGSGLFRLSDHPSRRRLTPADMWRAIDAYMMRSLTFEQDALNAISGILRTFEKSTKPIYHYWGVPVIPPYTWQSGKVARTAGSYAHGFATALTWYHTRPARRRLGFPSWSWTGWHWALPSSTDDAKPRLDRSYNGCRCKNKAIEFSATSASGEMLNWTMLLELMKTDDRQLSLPQVINISAPTLSFEFVYISPLLEVDGYSESDHTGFYACCQKDVVKTFDGDNLSDCTMYIEMIPSTDPDDVLRRRLLKDSFTGIILGCQNRTALVVDCSGDVAQRIGIVDLRLSRGFIKGLDQASNDIAMVRYEMKNFDEWAAEKTRQTIPLG